MEPISPVLASPPKSTLSIFTILLVIILLLSSSATAYLYFQNRNLQQQLADLTQRQTIPIPNPIPTPLQTATPSASPTTEATSSANFVCPPNGWVDCMPTTDGARDECSARVIDWYEQNCPNFQGVAY